jgi:hypothetical protein
VDTGRDFCYTNREMAAGFANMANLKNVNIKNQNAK